MTTGHASGPESSEDSVEESAPVSLPAESIALIQRVRADATDEAAWDALDEIARSTERPDRVSVLYRDALAKELTIEAVEKVGRRAVAFHEEWFEDPSLVIDILKRVLELDARAEWAFERLSLLLTMGERWEDLLSTYDVMLAACDDRERKKSLLDEAARIAKDFAGSTDRAISYLKQLVPLRPEDSQLAQSLERRLLLQRRYRDLIDVWSARLPVLPPAEVLLTRVRIAETWLERLNEGETALAVVRTIFGAGNGEPQGARLLERIGTHAAAPLETRRAALSLLKERFTSAGRSPDVLRAIELLLGVADEPAERAALRREAAERYAEDGQFDAAVKHAAEWLVLSPTRDVKAALENFAASAEKTDLYADALVRAAEATTDGSVRVEFLLAAGKERSDALGDPSGGIQLYTRVLSDSATSEASLVDVARRLSALLVGPEHASQRLSVLEKRSEIEPEADDRRLVLGEAARLAESLGDADHALILWQRRLSHDATDAEALDATVAILGANRRWESLVKALGQRHDIAFDPGVRRSDLVRIAEVQRSEIGDLSTAIETWHRIEAEFGASADTMDALADLSAAANRWSDVTALLRQAARQVEDPERRAAHLARMGDVYRTQRAAPLRAVEAYREALEIHPAQETSRDGLRALLDDREAGGFAVEAFAKAFADAAEWRGTLELVERRVERANDDAFRGEVLLEAAGILEARNDDLNGALGYVRRAFALLLHPSIESELVRLAEATGGWDVCAAGYADAIAVAKNEERRSELLFSHGTILEQRKSDPEGALVSYGRVSDSRPGDLNSTTALIRVAALTSRWEVAARAVLRSAAAREALSDEVVQTFDSMATRVAGWERATASLADELSRANLSGSVLHDVERQLALWHRDRREDPDAAEAVLRRAVTHKIQEDTLRMLADLERRHPDRRLVGTLLQLATETGEDLQILREAGTVALHAVRDPELAGPILARTLEVASIRWRDADRPHDETDPAGHAEWAIEELVRLRLAEDDVARAADLLESGAALPFDKAAARALLFRAAELAAARLGDTARAVSLSRAILEEAPDDALAITLLATLYAKEGCLEELLELRRRELTLGPPLERRLFLRLDVARVLGQLRSDDAGLALSLRDNLADRPGHVESIDALARVLEAEGRHAEVFAELSRQAAQTEELGETAVAANLWARAGKLSEVPLGDVEHALDAYRRSAALEPSVVVFDALADIHAAKREHGAAVSWLEKRLERTSRDETNAFRSAVKRLAAAYGADGRETESVHCLVDALTTDPAATELRQMLADSYRASSDFALLAPLLATGVEFVQDAKEKVNLLRQAAQVQRRRLGSLADAIPLLERAAALAPEDRAVRLSLADALRSTGRFDDARVLLETMLAEFGRRRTPERAAVHYHLARIAESEGNLEQALAQLEAASSIERSDPKILRLLGNVARKKGEIDAAERAYRALLLIVRRQQPVTPGHDNEEEIVAASEVMFDLHRMAAEQGQTDRANDLLESAFETAAENNFEALELERALRASGQTELVLRVLDARLDRITEPEAAADIFVARADLLAETDRLEEALMSLLDALGKTPAALTILSSAHDLAVRAGALDRYISRLAELAEHAEAEDPSLAGDLWMRLGAIAENETSDKGLAATFYERSLSTGRKALRAYRAASRVVEDEDVKRRAELLRKFVEAKEQDADQTVRNDALYRLAEIELAAAETAARGASVLAEALDLAPDYERAKGLLAPALAGTQEPAVVAVYERVARALGDETLVLDALFLASELPLVSFESLVEAVELAHKIGIGGEPRLATLLERLVAAARKEDRASEVTSALVDLAGIREASSDAESAARLLEEAARASGSDSFDLWLRVAELAAGPLGDLRRAAAVYEELRRAEPADSRTWMPLLDLYRRLSSWTELEACIASTVDAVYDPDERNHLRMERGRILLEDPARRDDAEAVLREVLDEDPDHVQASVVLAELLERSGRFQELSELLERQLEAAKDRKDGGAVAAIALRMGQGLEAADRTAAMSLYRDSLEFAPTDRALLGALLRLYGPNDDQRDRAFVMDRLLQVEVGPPAATLALDLAALLELDGDAEGAERVLRRGYEACPTSVEVRERLTGWYTDRQDFEGLAGILVTTARGTRDVTDAVQKLREAARIYRESLSDSARAVDLLAEARDLAPDDVDLVEELIVAATDAGRTEDALAVVSDAVSSRSASPSSRARLLVLRARLTLQLSGTTIPVFEAAIADLDQAAALADGGYEAELIEVLDAERLLAAEQENNDVERVATMRLAQVLPKIGDQRRGLELLVGWVKRKPNDADAVRGLGQFAANAEKWSAAAKAFSRLVEITDGGEQMDAVIRLAEACERAGTPMDARPALEQAYARAPEDDMLRSRLRRMYESAGAFAELAAIMIAEADRAIDEGARFERLREAGDLSLRVPGGERTAIEAFRKAQALRPDDHRVVIKLAEALSTAGEIEEAAALLDRTIETFGKRRSPELGELQHAMARIGRLAGDWEAVLAWLDAAVQTDRQNGAAASELAIIAMDRDEFDIAIKALQAITLIKGEAPMSKAEAYLRQGIIAEKKGDPKKGIFLAKRALTQDPEYADARAFLDRIAAG